MLLPPDLLPAAITRDEIVALFNTLGKFSAAIVHARELTDALANLELLGRGSGSTNANAEPVAHAAPQRVPTDPAAIPSSTTTTHSGTTRASIIGRPSRRSSTPSGR